MWYSSRQYFKTRVLLLYAYWISRQYIKYIKTCSIFTQISYQTTCIPMYDYWIKEQKKYIIMLYDYWDTLTDKCLRYMHCCWMITELHHLTIRSAIRPAVVQSSVCNSFAELTGNFMADNSFMSVGGLLQIQLSDCCNWVDVNRSVGTATKQNLSHSDNNLYWVFWWSLSRSPEFSQTIITLCSW